MIELTSEVVLTQVAHLKLCLVNYFPDNFQDTVPLKGLSTLTHSCEQVSASKPLTETMFLVRVSAFPPPSHGSATPEL